MDSIEVSFGVRMPISAIFRSPTARQMLASLVEADKGQAWRILVALQPEGTRPPLYCIHGVPGTLFEYDNLVRPFCKDQPVYGIQSPGLDGVSWTPDDVEVTASLYVNVIRGHQPHGPYYLIAYCAGGPFAYEVARQLMSAGETVSFLGFIDYKAPKQEIRSTFWSCYRYVCDNAGGAVAHIASFGRSSPGEKAVSLLALPGFLIRKVLRLPAEVVSSPSDLSVTGVAPALNVASYPDWVMSMSKTQQAVAMKNYDAIGRYNPAPCNVKVTIFMSSENVRSSRRSGKYERTFGWKRLALGGVSCHVIKGDHGSIISQDSCNRIASIIREGMDKSRETADEHGR